MNATSPEAQRDLDRLSSCFFSPEIGVDEGGCAELSAALLMVSVISARPSTAGLAFPHECSVETRHREGAPGAYAFSFFACSRSIRSLTPSAFAAAT